MRPPERPKLLVTVDDFHASLAAVRALHAAGFAPVVAVSGPGTYAARSRAAARVVQVPDPEQAPASFVAAVAEAARSLGVAGVLPASEASLIALARGRASIPVAVGAPATSTVALATDKGAVLDLAHRSGFATPVSSVGSPSELARRADSLAYPAILKPQRSRVQLADGRLAYFAAQLIRTPEALRAAVSGVPGGDWVVQPYLSGELCAISGLAWEGQVSCTIHQVSRRIWPPDVGYSCYAQTVTPDPELEAATSRLVQAIGWSGIFQLQMLRLPDGRKLAIDFNPRVYGSLALAVRAGVNLPSLWACRVLGLPQPESAHRYEVGVRYRLEPADGRAITALLRDKRFAPALAAMAPRRRTAHAAFSARDPAPVAVPAQRVLAKAWRRRSRQPREASAHDQNV